MPIFREGRRGIKNQPHNGAADGEHQSRSVRGRAAISQKWSSCCEQLRKISMRWALRSGAALAQAASVKSAQALQMLS